MKIAFGILQDEFELSGEFQVYRGWIERVKQMGFDIVPFSARGPRFSNEKIIFNKQGEFLFKKYFDQWKLIRWAYKLAPQVNSFHLFLPTPESLWIADRVKKEVNKPVAVTVLSERPVESPDQWVKLIIKSFRFYMVRLLVYLTAARIKFLCDWYGVGSQTVINQLSEMGCPKEKSRIVPFFIPSEEPPDPSSLEVAQKMKSKPTFLYMGHVLPNKGVENLLGAFSKVEDKSTQLLLIWSGLGNIKIIKKHITTLKIEGRVDIMAKPVHRSTVMKEALALVLPFQVSFGQVSPPVLVSEALRAGVPLVVSNFVCLKGLVEESKTGYLVDPKSVADLTRAMNHVRKDKSAGAQMRQNQREQFESYNQKIDLAEYQRFLTSNEN